MTAPRKRKPKADPAIADDWQTLVLLIQSYSEAAIAESWKGGGDPQDWEVIKLRLKLARLELNTHIIKMKERHE